MSREELPPIRAATRADIDLAVDPDHIEDRDRALFWRQSHAALDLALAVYRDDFEAAAKSAGFDRAVLLRAGPAQVGIAWKGSLAVVSVRGTDQGLDWLFNLASLARVGWRRYLPKGVKVGLGFREQVRRVLPQLIREVKTHQVELSSVELILTGHSLGAAMATILVPVLSTLPGIRIHSALLFESPRVGGRRWAEWFNEAFQGLLVIGFVNVLGDSSDVVSRLPPSRWFCHVMDRLRVTLLPEKTLFGLEAWREYRERNPLSVWRRYLTRFWRSILAHRGPALLRRIKREVIR